MNDYLHIIKNYNKYIKFKEKDQETHYYFVGFYGSIFDKLNEKEFIYQSHDSYETFVNEIKTIVPLDKKGLIKELEEGKNPRSLPPDEIYIRVSEVKPIFDETNENGQYTTKTFVYEYIKGNETGEIDKISKRKIEYVTKQTLPSVTRRQLVVEKLSDVYLSAIETCMDQIDLMTSKLQSASREPITSDLTKILKELLLDKNGAIDMIDIFLVKNPKSYNADNIMEMWELINNMISFIKKALPIHLRKFPGTAIHNQFVSTLRDLEKTLLTITPTINEIIETVPKDYDDDLFF